MDLEFNEEGCLPFGIYEMSISEFEDLFSKNKSDKRKHIMDYYKEYLEKLLNSEYILNHWADGSFVTLKDEPNDIDTLTEIDGLKCDENGVSDKIHKLIDYAPLWTENLCNSLGAYKYPEEFEVEYASYNDVMTKTLCILFARNKITKNPKGFVKIIDFNKEVKK